MEYRILEINVRSARDIKDVMDVYVVASIDGDPYNHKQETKTPVDHDGGKSPTWNFQMKFIINEVAAQHNRLTLKLAIRCERALADKDGSLVTVPIKELLSSTEEQEGKENDNKPKKVVTYQVRSPSGRAQGELSLSYKMGQKLISEAAHDVAKAYPIFPRPSSSNLVGGPYPPAGYPPPPHGYPLPPQPHYGGYGHTYPPHPLQPHYGGYGHTYPPRPLQPYPPHPPPPPPSGYGFAAHPPPGYGYARPVQQQANMTNIFNMFLEAGLIGGALGGLFTGDIVSDAAAYDVYDAGFDGACYDASFDEAGGFDF